VRRESRRTPASETPPGTGSLLTALSDRRAKRRIANYPQLTLKAYDITWFLGGGVLQKNDSNALTSAGWIYHAAPLIAAIAVVSVFLGVFFYTNSYFKSGLAAAIPAIVLIWRWSVAGRLIDSWSCPQCGQNLERKLIWVWVYPPKKCPHFATSLQH
jgi:hypothetical protein